MRHFKIGMHTPDELYHKETKFSVARWASFAFGLSAVGFLYLEKTNPVGSNPPPDGYYLAMGVFITLVALLVFRFRKIVVSITLDAIVVSFGLFPYRIPRRRILDAFVDEKPGIIYGGWGLRIDHARGKLALVYSVLNAPRIVIQQKGSRYGYFIFSTRNPEEIIGIIRKQAKLN